MNGIPIQFLNGVNDEDLNGLGFLWMRRMLANRNIPIATRRAWFSAWKKARLEAKRNKQLPPWLRKRSQHNSHWNRRRNPFFSGEDFL